MSGARCQGMALAVTMVLLLGLAILALAGSAAAVAALSLAGLDEQASLAFEAAEAGVVRALRAFAAGDAVAAAGAFEPTWPELDPGVTTRVQLRADPGEIGATLAEGFSIGSGVTFARRHFTLISDGRAGRGTAVRIEQGLAVIAPTRPAAP